MSIRLFRKRRNNRTEFRHARTVAIHPTIGLLKGYGSGQRNTCGAPKHRTEVRRQNHHPFGVNTATKIDIAFNINDLSLTV
ncbi:Uncharacterised protein [Vibrio cholerae]|nr:Uncharacterised protein [Vibrio cholerae]CSB36688.1 Uncharacterised protein [Vibrio cholerae]CSC06520.1 Uncharacterised protein [Vibrio cholerae]CSC77679.1 Uncharacterised protein [Vibrio cholerae]CSI50339.1 Uncharacterised protein [Vibrio cholerae]